MDRQTSHPTIQRGRPVSGREAAHANEYFDPFLNATTLKNILGYYRSICEFLHLKPNVFPQFYPKLRANLTSWRAKALWKKFDARASHKCYGKGKISANTRVLIIGAGPCGLRSAIEAQLLGAKVVVIEKRDRLSRNNVLHLWPFVIEDLRALGAKKFFGKFCAGAIDHISIRQLQCILLKVALLLGVEIHTEVSFEQLIEPSEKCGWKAEFKPTNHPVSQYEFDVIIGADGKRNTLQGFKRKEFRGKLAIAITANFINKKTEAEARVEEISGVAFIFNQKFFKDLQEQTKIDLENIVYYKDDTHYFVMTAKKASLLEKGVIKRDLADTERLLALENVDREALHAYAREAANFSTNYQMPDLEFAVNHYGQPDVAMFDFTSMYAAENASKVIERNGYRLLMILVGDSLLEPFWPTGSGCARGFLSSLDAAWAIRSWTLGTASALDVLAERESIYRLLAQTTPDNLNKDWKSYTLDPITRYPNLNKNKVLPQQTFSLFETDNPASVEKMRKNVLETMSEVPKKRRRGNVDNEVLLNWITEQTRDYADIKVTDIASVFRDGRVLSAIINHYRPDLLDYSGIQANAIANNQHAFDVLEKELGVSPLMTADQIADTEDYLTMSTYVTNVYDVFRGEIPHVKHPKLELPEQAKRPELTPNSFKRTVGIDAPHPVLLSRPTSRHKRHADAMLQNRPNSVDRKTRKRRTLEKVGVGVEERQKMLSEIASNRNERQNRRRMQRRLQTEQFVKSMQMLQANAKTDNSQPFEDYSIFLYRQTAPNFEDRVKDLERKFTYVPDHDHKLPNQNRGNADEDFATRIKNMEDKWRDTQPADKKPKDLLRAIGKIETSDWNIKEIEKKILENKLGKTVNKDKEKVPKWSKEQFIARQTKMEKQHLDRQDSSEAKYADIDKNIKHLELKLKEGTSRDLGKKKVATITEKFATKVVAPEAKIEKSNSRPALVLPNQATTSEFCHFCAKRVYLMERLSAEGRFFHHGCFKCQYCHTQLRLGSYAFDRDGLYDNKFFCIHHYGMQGEIRPAKVHRRTSQRHAKSPDKRTNIQGVDLLDRRVAVQTPERIEFSNLSTASNVSSDHEESLSQMDEDEWTDKNFGASCAEELDESASDSSSLSDTDSDDEDAFDDALEEPATKEGTLKWAERFHKCYSRKRHDSRSDDYSSSDQSSYYEENTSDDDDSDTATEGEDEIRARELRKQEVRVEPPIVQTDTGTDTEIVTTESSESSSEIQNSATEISTDSEFAHDDPTPTREIPSIVLNDFNVVKTRGCGTQPRKIQVTSGYIHTAAATNGTKPNIELKLRPLVASTTPIKKPALNLLPRTEGYALNRTQSTGGIAAKVSLELKKKYLLGGDANAGNIQKSGSASTLDTKFKSFHTNISDCQKLLKPAAEISASMKNFCHQLDERHSPVVAAPPPPDVVTDVFQNESEGRPRSPVHETSIIVPEIDWTRGNKEDSQSEDSLLNSSSEELAGTPNFEFKTIPRVEIHVDDGNIALDSLCVEQTSLKSISSEKKTLNQPKSLPVLKDVLLHCEKEKTVSENSGRSSPDAAALTETELSDWARDEAGSEEFDLHFDNHVPNKPLAKLAEPEDQSQSHVCGKEVVETKNPMCNLDNIEFMDTGTETSSDEGVADSQNGYELLKDEYELADSLNPSINEVVEAKNIAVNTGYCVLANESNNFGGQVIDLQPSDLAAMLRHKQINNEPEEDSLLIVETGTTTEENTCSDSTVKNVTELALENGSVKQRLEEKLAQVKAEQALLQKASFDEHCQRLQSKVEFGNAKDSIDVRKLRRKSKDVPSVDEPIIKPPLIPTTPDVLYKKEVIKKERDVNQKLIQEMVMNKMKAENKTLDRKKRNRTISSLSPARPYELTKSATADLVPQINPTPDILLSSVPLQKSRPLSVYASFAERKMAEIKHNIPTGEFATPTAPPRLKHEQSKQDARMRARLLSNEDLGLSPEDKLVKLREKILKRGKENSNVNVQESIESLVLNTERRNSWLYSNDTLNKKKTSSFRRSKSGDSEKNLTCKSTNDIKCNESVEDALKICKSDPNLLDTDGVKLAAKKGKPKDRERRKSITKMFTTLFGGKNKSPTAGAKGLFGKVSPKSKNLSKSCANLELNDYEIVIEEKNRSKSYTEVSAANNNYEEPPPVPPFPLNYTGSIKDDSSDTEQWIKDRSSCDTIDQSGMFDNSTTGFNATGRRSSKSARKQVRHAQLKRHRMAQEIQRKLEETEVKTRELEERGVVVEKSLRGEDCGECSKNESDLLQEWFDLMRDRTELRRYEKELMVRAEELELEDRHARLQHDLRERLEKDTKKTEDDVKVEESIINEMMEIVAKRDSLIGILEEDRLRYSNEDRDLEEQMLAKGLRLTPIRKTPEK